MSKEYKTVLINLLSALKNQPLRIIDRDINKLVHVGELKPSSNLTEGCQKMWLYKRVKSILPRKYNLDGIDTLVLEIEIGV